MNKHNYIGRLLRTSISFIIIYTKSEKLKIKRSS